MWTLTDEVSYLFSRLFSPCITLPSIDMSSGVRVAIHSAHVGQHSIKHPGISWRCSLKFYINYWNHFSNKNVTLIGSLAWACIMCTLKKEEFYFTFSKYNCMFKHKMSRSGTKNREVTWKSRYKGLPSVGLIAASGTKELVTLRTPQVLTKWLSLWHNILIGLNKTSIIYVIKGAP